MFVLVIALWSWMTDLSVDLLVIFYMCVMPPGAVELACSAQEQCIIHHVGKLLTSNIGYVDFLLLRSLPSCTF